MFIRNPFFNLAHLAVITSAEEEEVLQRLRRDAKKLTAWVGFHDLFQEDDWVSVLDEQNGSKGVYIHWSSTIPNLPDNLGGNQHCAGLISEGLDDKECSNIYPYICKISLEKLKCR